MENTSITKDVAILILGAVAGLLPWLLDKVGIEMPKPLASVFLYLSVLVVIWALVKLGWLGKIPFIEGKTISLSTALLLCAGALAEAGLWIHQRQTFHFDANVKFEPISNHLFVNEVVELDGKEYFECTFRNVTLKYNGTTPVKFHHNKIQNTPGIVTDNPAVFATIGMLKGVGFLAVDAPLLEGPNQKPVDATMPNTK